jgi:demethylmenaquinone methyltransferase/2-methoxy-6-polyprenyl-1,4-benzoquinol methylase
MITGGTVSKIDDDLIEQQKAYYRVRAGEYDEWFLRQGRYDHGSAFRARWEAEVGEVRRALARFHPTGRVLELACGTGWWTEALAAWAEQLTAVDASAEVLALNAERVPDPKVRRVQADLFAWTPDGGYDAVFFSFWLSHVPPERFEAFWAMVRGALNPGGRVFFVDSLRTELSTAADHVLPGEDDIIAERRLNDGSRYSIYKIFYDPADLQARLEALGWRAVVTSTESFFLHGQAEPAT